MVIKMSFVFALLTLLLWASADLFYKKGNNIAEKDSHLKTGMIVGFIMGMHMVIYCLINKSNIVFIDIIKYLPVSFCYLLSMVIGYKGLKYLKVSIISPIENSSGFITSILLLLIFKLSLTKIEIIGLIFLFLGVIGLSINEIIQDKENRHDLIKGITLQAIIFPLFYALFDGLGTFLDAVYLDELNLISSDMALISYEFTFFVYAVIIFIILKKRNNKEKMFIGQKDKFMAGLFETLGQFTYVYAISENSVITVPVIACYSGLSVLLASIFLKEKLKIWDYLFIAIIIVGVFLLGMGDVNE